MTGPGDTDITDYIAQLLLRYFRQGTLAGTGSPVTDRDKDRDLLRLHWAISTEVRVLTSYVLEHKNEMQSVLTDKVRTDDGPIRGRFDGRATMIQRLLRGHNAVTVSHEPVRSFATGPNHVLGWVIQQAWLLNDRFLSLLPPDASYRPIVEEGAVALMYARKIDAVQRATAEINLGNRPSHGALRAASRSRRPVYRHAYRAYLSLLAMEAGEPTAIEAVLRDTLLAPIDVWRRFELAVALALARAIQADTDCAITLNILAGDSRTPIARVGSVAIFWQTKTKLYSSPQPEPSEIVLQTVLAGYGLKPDSDRPDLIVVDEAAGQVVAIVEAKYFASAGEDAWDRLRDAAHQLVRYGRGYRPLGEIDQLLSQSVIALVRKPPLPTDLSKSQPFVFGFDDMQTGNLADWAAAIRQQ